MNRPHRLKSFVPRGPSTKPTTRTQAERVISKFGGARRLVKLLKALFPDQALVPSSIYRWRYPAPRGTGGVIPTRTIPLLIQAAAVDGIFLTQEDLYPGPITKRHWDEEEADGKPVVDEDIFA